MNTATTEPDSIPASLIGRPIDPVVRLRLLGWVFANFLFWVILGFIYVLWVIAHYPNEDRLDLYRELACSLLPSAVCGMSAICSLRSEMRLRACLLITIFNSAMQAASIPFMVLLVPFPDPIRFYIGYTIFQFLVFAPLRFRDAILMERNPGRKSDFGMTRIITDQMKPAGLP